MSGTALGVIAAILLFTIVVGWLAVRNVKMDPTQYIVGGRSFGPILLWLLMAGEIYTSFTFLGAAGWAYTRGAPAFYILCYGTVAYILSYFMLPPIWRIANEHGLLTGPDYFRHVYGSKWLGSLVAIVGFVFLVPYVTLQLSGLEILLRIAGYGTLNSILTVGIAFALIVLFVFFMGLRGTAWASIVKDTLVLLGVIFAGVFLPIHFFGSPTAVIDRVLAQTPNWMTLQGTTTPNGTVWFVSTVILTALGFFMFPQSMAVTYSAKSPDTIRRNAIFLPFYQLMLLLVYFAGFTALLVHPGLKGPAGDQSFMLVVQQYFPPWVLGAVAGAGCLAALVPASAQVLAAASLVSKNLLADYGFVRTEAGATMATRISVIIIAVLAFAFWAVARTSLVGLLLIAYNGVTQFFPGVVLSLSPRTRPHPAGVGAGIIVGIATLAYFAATGASIPWGLNNGFLALILNVITLVVVSLALGRRAVSASP
ncbi:MAG: sodium:solute symporter family protein [Vulcanimicrobiaceae bacterium]|jgi:SSS family solute:Na+ symporter